MKKSKTNSKNKEKAIGQFEILKETSKKYINWEVEMSDGLHKFLEKEGRKEAEKDPNFFINLGFVRLLEKSLSKMGSKKK